MPVIAITNLSSAINLSKRAQIQIKSAFPDIEASADNQYVAVVWSKGYDAADTTKEFGYIVLKSANVSTGWENQVNVYTPTTTLWGTQPRLVFDPNNSSMVYVTWVECQNQTAGCSKVKMTTCTLSGADSCTAPQTVASQNGSELATPDIAADSGSRLHVVWKNNTAGTIQYSRYNGTSWSSPDDAVTDSGGNISYNPALVWSSGGGGRLHLTWYQYNSTSANRRIKYSTDADLSNNVWDNNASVEWTAPSGNYRFTGGTNEPVIKPSIAASGTYVYLIWDAYDTTTTSPNDNKFVLAYDWSTDNGASWKDKSGNTTNNGCGTAGDGCGIPDAVAFANNPAYLSPFASIAEEDTLRPSIAISNTMPAIVWHYKDLVLDENGIYLVVYRAYDGSNWTAPITITQNLDYDGDGVDGDTANADLAIWSNGDLHIAHMGLWGDAATTGSDWDIYYRGAVTTDNSTDGVNQLYLPIVMKSSQ